KRVPTARASLQILLIDGIATRRAVHPVSSIEIRIQSGRFTRPVYRMMRSLAISRDYPLNECSTAFCFRVELDSAYCGGVVAHDGGDGGGDGGGHTTTVRPCDSTVINHAATCEATVIPHLYAENEGRRGLPGFRHGGGAREK